MCLCVLIDTFFWLKLLFKSKPMLHCNTNRVEICAVVMRNTSNVASICWWQSMLYLVLINIDVYCWTRHFYSVDWHRCQAFWYTSKLALNIDAIANVFVRNSKVINRERMKCVGTPSVNRFCPYLGVCQYKRKCWIDLSQWHESLVKCRRYTLTQLNHGKMFACVNILVVSQHVSVADSDQMLVNLM